MIDILEKDLSSIREKNVEQIESQFNKVREMIMEALKKENPGKDETVYMPEKMFEYD